MKSHKMRRLAIITTHPIQYYAPLFQLLQQRNHVAIKVFYTWGQSALPKHDPGFGKAIEWDIPLLDGYPYEFIENTSAQPGSHHGKGIVNPMLIPRISEWQPDAVLVFGWLYDSHLKVMRHFKNKIPVLFRGDSTLLDEKPGIKSMLRFLFLRWVYRFADYALYPGSNNKAYFKKYGFSEEQLVFAPHAVDNERFAASRADEAQLLRSRLGLTANDVLILYAGKFEEKKAPALLVDAFIELQNPNCHLLMAGNGELETILKQSAAGNPNIHFMDFQNQTYMPVLYQACDLFCLPSKGPNETWGLAVNEAMASSKAVLVSNKVGCAADLVHPGQNGAIFKSGDKSSLLNTLKALTRQKITLTVLGKNSGEKIKDWNFTKIAEAIEYLAAKPKN